MTTEEENLALELIRGLRGDVAQLDARLEETRLELKAEFQTQLRGGTNSLRADMLAFQIATLQKQISEQLEDLRLTIVDYLSAVVRQALSAATSTPLAPTQRRIAPDGA